MKIEICFLEILNLDVILVTREALKAIFILLLTFKFLRLTNDYSLLNYYTKLLLNFMIFIF
jgi:hypothetical protein